MTSPTQDVETEEAALRDAAMLLAAWVQRNGYDAFKWRGRVAAEGEAEGFTLDVRLAAIPDDSAARTKALQAFLAGVAKEFGGKLPGDAWHLYLARGLTPAEAAAEHRRMVQAQAQ